MFWLRTVTTSVVSLARRKFLVHRHLASTDIVHGAPKKRVVRELTLTRRTRKSSTSSEHCVAVFSGSSRSRARPALATNSEAPKGYISRLGALQTVRYTLATPDISASAANLTAAAPRMTASHQPVLDRQKFTQKLTLKALRMHKQHCHRYMRLLRSFVFDRPKMRTVIVDQQEPNKRLLLLREDIDTLESQEIPASTLEALKVDMVEETAYEVTMEYSHLALDAVLRQILPSGWEIPSSFETVGHIAHLNLKDECLPYRHVIGQVILDKNPCIKTVVNKVGTIENEYRVLPLEVVAGEHNLEATVVQHGARFRLNYAEVYWNSRLEQEHHRLVEQFRPGEIVADVMAGIGPFAIPAGLQGNEVYANDLNPRSFHYLQQNILLNKVSSHVRAFQVDGRDFIQAMAGAEKPAAGSSGNQDEGPGQTGQNGAAPASEILMQGVRFHHAVMNLPATAVEFLDAFKGAFSRKVWREDPLPLVHVYTFAKNTEKDAELRKRVEGRLGGQVDSEELKIRLVRDVAPNKRMMCVTFRVPEDVAYAAGERAEPEQLEAPKKKTKFNC